MSTNYRESNPLGGGGGGVGVEALISAAGARFSLPPPAPSIAQL